MLDAARFGFAVNFSRSVSGVASVKSDWQIRHLK
jgi:hypothetical protein